MRLKLKKLWHLRPRVLTAAAVAIAGAMIVLANLTDEIERRGAEVLAGSGQLRFSLQDPEPIDRRGGILGLFSVSYGWPLLWRQYIFGNTMISDAVLGESYSCCAAAVSGDMASPTGLESLLALTHLKTLHVDEPMIGAQPAAGLELDEDDSVLVLEVDLDRCRRALDALRKSNPGILVVNDVDAEEAIIWPGEPYVATEFEIGSDEKSLAGSRSYLDASMRGPRLPTKYWPRPVNTE